MNAPHARRAVFAGAARITLGVVLVAALVMLGVLGLRIQAALDELRSEARDNLFWNLSQIEVDVVRLSEEVRAGIGRGPTPLTDLRRRYDLLYSRAQNAIAGNGYDHPGLEDQARSIATLLAGFLERTTPLIDGPDEALRQRLPALAGDLATLRDALRRTTTRMVEALARFSDERREAFSALVRQMALATATVIAILVGLLTLVVRLNRTALREARQTAQTSNRLTATVDSALDAIIVIDADGNVIQYNPSAESIFGYARGEAIGRDLASLIVPPGLRAAHAAGMARMRATGHLKMANSGRFQTEAMHSSGRIFPVEAQISSAEGPDGILFVAFLRDISDRLAAEAALTRARDTARAAERAKTEFIALMSHEMRTPLNGVMASLEIARRKVTDSEASRFLVLAQDSARLLLRHANDVLDITRMESGGFTLTAEAFDVATFASGLVEAIRPICDEKGIAVTFAMVTESARVEGDTFRIGQILQNFLSNAAKFVEHGGLTVEAEAMAVEGGACLVEFRVIDTGPGIAPDDQARIFDDFVMLDTSLRRTMDGAGLGLGIARRLAAAMGGEIGVESEVGEGSCFWLRLTLPRAQAPGMIEEGDGASSPSLPEPAPALDILVVEDNATNRLVLEEMLRPLGHRVEMAHDGRAGAAMAAARRYDLILMDISMPVMDGLAASRLIRAGGASTASRIVAVTAHSMPQDQERFRAAGMDDALVKPISSEGLARILAGGGLVAAAPGDALLDADRIADLRRSVGPQVLARLGRTFLRDGAGQAGRALAMAGDAPAASDLAALCHEAAGTAAVFGAARLAAHFRRAEGLALEGSVPQAAAHLLEATPGLWDATRAAVDELLRDLERTPDPPRDTGL